MFVGSLIILTETTATFIHSVPRSIDITAAPETELTVQIIKNKVTEHAHGAFFVCRIII